MSSGMLSPECLRFLETVFFASIGSAVVRGAASQHDNPLVAFRTYYLDLSASFLGLAFLRSSLPTPSTDFSFLSFSAAVSSSREDLVLPIAVMLLLVGVLAVRARWKHDSHRRWADLAATVVVIAVVVIASWHGTSAATNQQRFDRLSNGILAAYCGSAGSDDAVAEVTTTSRGRSLVAPTEDVGALTAPLESALAFTTRADLDSGVTMVGRWRKRPRAHSRESGPGLGSGSDQSFCQALRLYVQLRESTR
jgi:hypothetical protein